ncbi:MAG: SDR family oxidoreductase [Deltaproteobacteria bacterium]|nr:SDR family oxidoreductase [Deltaproteobacteria bacterium]
MKFKGKKALITGSSRGLGKAIALNLAKAGCDIIVHYRRDEGAAAGMVQELQQLGVNADLAQADLVDIQQVKKLWQEIKVKHPQIDFFIANAASTAFKPLLMVEEKHIQMTFDLVVKGFVLGVKEVVNVMPPGGAIIAISGMDTLRVCPNHGLLGAAKASLEMLIRYYAVELAEKKIYCYGLNPGFLDTDSTRFYLGSGFEQVLGKVQSQAPYPAATQSDEMAKLVNFLCTEAARSLTGQTLIADGGSNSLFNLG